MRALAIAAALSFFACGPATTPVPPVLANTGGTATEGLSGIRGLERALAIGVHTDILFPLQQQQEIADGLRAAGCDATFLPLPSPQGHDAFLVDSERFGPALRDFLAG